MHYESFLVFERIVRLMSATETDTNRSRKATSNMWLLLKFINESNTVTSTDVAERFTIKHPTATQLINRAESLGYLTRVPGKKDKRMAFLKLTASGKKQVSTLSKYFDKRSLRAIKYLSDDEHTQLVALLGKMMNGLESEVDLHKAS